MPLNAFFQRAELFLRSSGELSTREAPWCSAFAFYKEDLRDRHQLMASQSFPRTRSSVIGSHGSAYWEQLVAQYFELHPPPSHSVLTCLQGFPEHLAALERWWGEAADYELRLLDVTLQPDEPAREGTSHPLALHPTFLLRLYQHDLGEWSVFQPPPKRPTLIVFWRDRLQQSRALDVGRVELELLYQVAHHLPLTPEQQNIAEKLFELGVLITP